MRRPSRERESLVNERSRIINRMKSALARRGIRGFKPHLRRAPERLAYLRTAEGTAARRRGRSRQGRRRRRCRLSDLSTAGLMVRASRCVSQGPQRNRLRREPKRDAGDHLLDGHYDRLPSVMADLIRRVAVIVTPGELAVAEA